MGRNYFFFLDNVHKGMLYGLVVGVAALRSRGKKEDSLLGARYKKRIKNTAYLGVLKWRMYLWEREGQLRGRRK